MKIRLHTPLCLCELGQRGNNEDAVFPPVDAPKQQAEHQLFMVCDGVGGLEKGEIASNLVCEVVAGFLSGRSSISSGDIDQAVLLAEKKIQAHIDQNQDAGGMATTLTLLATHEKGITIAHLGDSRIYHIRGGNILYKTFDHSLVNEMVANNIISEVEAMNHPKRNVVTKVVMAGGEHLQPDVHLITDLMEGDYFFLCTDGILESLSDFDIALLLNNEALSNEQKIAQIKERCANTSKDNHSAYLLQIKSIESSKAVSTINNVVWQNPKFLLYTLVGLMVFVFGIFFLTRPSDPPVESSIEDPKKNNIESALGILDSIDVDDMDLSNVDSIGLSSELPSSDSTITQKTPDNLSGNTDVLTPKGATLKTPKEPKPDIITNDTISKTNKPIPDLTKKDTLIDTEVKKDSILRDTQKIEDQSNQ